MLELTKAAFPDGKVPMPYPIFPLAQNDLRLPFVRAISPYDSPDGLLIVTPGN